MLSLVVFTPLIGVLLLLFVPGSAHRAIRWIALAAAHNDGLDDRPRIEAAGGCSLLERAHRPVLGDHKINARRFKRLSRSGHRCHASRT